MDRSRGRRQAASGGQTQAKGLVVGAAGEIDYLRFQDVRLPHDLALRPFAFLGMIFERENVILR